MTTNADIELEIARCLPDVLREFGILKEGYKCDVRLHRENRKKRRDAEFEGNWDSNRDWLRIDFLPMEEETVRDEGTVSPGVAKSQPVEDPLLDLLRALDRAEGRPGYEFVSLKWFRDTALTQEGFSWAANETARHDILSEAINKRWILTNKVANPRPPHFPVTAIRLNRQLPEVNAALGKKGGGLPAFRPIAIRGEALSATVLHDRR